MTPPLSHSSVLQSDATPATVGGTSSTTSNKISVFRIPDDRNESLEIVGESDHLGTCNDTIYAIRFIENMAYVAPTGEDSPFVVIHLTDRTNPTVSTSMETGSSEWEFDLDVRLNYSNCDPDKYDYTYDCDD